MSKIYILRTSHRASHLSRTPLLCSTCLHTHSLSPLFHLQIHLRLLNNDAESQAVDLERLSDLWGSYQDLRNHDVNKNLLIEKLFGEVNNLCVALERTRVQLADAEELKAIYYGRQKENATRSQALEAEKQRLQRDMFVYVLIDGDSMLFNDELVQDGENGGHEAASLLKGEIEQYLNTFDLVNRPTIRVQIFASLRGLAKSYVDAGVISDPATFQLFIRGFNMENALYEFIEAGNGKECADEKIRENFKLHVSIMQCRQIIFGGSTDNAYARLLGPYSRDEDYASRITMLEGAPFAMELRPFKNIFATTSFTSVFRSTKLEIKPSNYTPPPSVASTTSYSTIASAKNTTISVPVRTKSAAAVIEPLPPAPPSVTESVPASPPRPAEPKLLQNKAGHRVDSIIKYNELTVKEVKSRKMCNNFHLNGYCPYGDDCGHTHGKKLSDRQLEALRYIARTSPCGNGIWCELPSCVSGHRCPREPNCELYAIGKCRFKDNMHNVDMKVVDPYDVYIIK